MSSILKGLNENIGARNQVPIREDSDSQRLDTLTSIFRHVQAAISNDNKPMEIISAVAAIVKSPANAKKLGIDPRELEYHENKIIEAQENLESAILGLKEPFKEAIRELVRKADDADLDDDYPEELDEANMRENADMKRFASRRLLMRNKTEMDQIKAELDDCKSEIDQDLDEAHSIKDMAADLGKEGRPSKSRIGGSLAIVAEEYRNRRK